MIWNSWFRVKERHFCFVLSISYFSSHAKVLTTMRSKIEYKTVADVFHLIIFNTFQPFSAIFRRTVWILVLNIDFIRKMITGRGSIFINQIFRLPLHASTVVDCVFFLNRAIQSILWQNKLSNVEATCSEQRWWTPAWRIPKCIFSDVHFWTSIFP